MDSDDEHPNVKFGKPLELYDESNLPSKSSSVPIHEQTVTDENGRRRFHGAFTGGFSAGYYNTVGSKEGWTPSTFKSSRKDKETKIKRQTYRPQDFMDEEDMGDYGIAPKTVMAKTDFSSVRKRNYDDEKMVKEHKANATMFLGNQLLQSLVLPARNNIGIRLLKKLGWKEGQGVGARVSGRKPVTDMEKLKRIYGCDTAPSAQTIKDNDDDDDDRCYEDITFAPKDTMSIDIKPKDDMFGIGYSGLNPSQALRGNIERSSTIQFHTKTGKKMSFKGQAFGVGAFEDEDGDIYAQDSMENYDIAMGEEKNPDSTYGWTKPLALSGVEEKLALGERPSNEVKGFVAAKTIKLLIRKYYPPPQLPRDFDPNKRLKLHQEKQRIASMGLKGSGEEFPRADSKSSKYNQYNAEDRYNILQDSSSSTEVLSSNKKKEIKSVFELVSLEDRQRLRKVTNNAASATKHEPRQLGFTGELEQASQLKSAEEAKMKEDRTRPLCDINKLKPFANDPAKQRRYEQFERSVRQRSKDPYRDITSNLTEWERNQERLEFSRAAHVYLHLADSMNSKFEKAKTDEDLQEEEGGVSEPKKKIFGVLTHSTVEWHPDPLLCKRFNVPDPYPDSDIVGLESKSIFSSLRAIQMGSTSTCEAPRDFPLSSQGDDVRLPLPSAATPDDKTSSLKMETGVVSDTRRPPTFPHLKDRKSKRWDEKPQLFGPQLRQEEEQVEHQPPLQSEDVGAEAIEIDDDNDDVNDDKPSMDLFKSIFAAESDEDATSSDDDDDDVPADEVVMKPPVSAKHVFTKPSSFASDNGARLKHVFTKPKTLQRKSPEPELSVSPTEIFPTTTVSVSVSKDDIAAEELYGPPLPPPPPTKRPSFLKSFSDSSSSSTEDEDKKKKKHKKKKKKHKHKAKKKESKKSKKR